MRARSLRVGFASTMLALGVLGGAQAAEHQVSIEKFTFSPAELRVRKGDTVTWVNNEKRVSHSILFMGRGEESERFFPGEKWSRTFPEAGRFEYRCGPHPEMLGVVVVED